ncbi:hypothetical protein DWX41_05365 [Hungatella hathewayi]|uniref:DUF6774 domain-containing protein n=2 Tax=Lachnospirales TaxID=3085636 RepID=A0A3E2WZI1_9FIRM|nr:hypothetical protein [Faecalicatena contorta]RGC33795.1 hypothetical protein DWX41_05365 [Hungatella hathewayi]
MTNMNSCELVTYISSIACFLSKNCSTEELEMLAAIFSQLGDTLATILVNEANCPCDDQSVSNI